MCVVVCAEAEYPAGFGHIGTSIYSLCIRSTLYRVLQCKRILLVIENAITAIADAI